MRTSLLTISLACAIVVAPGGPSTAAITQPIVTVIRHGGLCATGSVCRSVLGVTDTTIFGQGYVPRRLSLPARTALLQAIAKLKPAYLRAHPFKGTCPTAYDGAESIYHFRGFAHALPSCTYDLHGVEAVRLTERLLSTLTPR
jgi:hypothetical protein